VSLLFSSLYSEWLNKNTHVQRLIDIYLPARDVETKDHHHIDRPDMLQPDSKVYDTLPGHFQLM
jgi:hypothetical protein